MTQEKTTVEQILYLVQTLSPDERAELRRRLDTGAKPISSELGKMKAGDVWGQFAEDADVLDEIVGDAMQERRRQLDRSLNA